MNRRHLLLSARALAVSFPLSVITPAWAANPAEDFISGNVQTGFDILNDKSTSADQRRERFASFLTGLTDMKRVALFLLGRYAATASPGDLDA